MTSELRAAAEYVLYPPMMDGFSDGVSCQVWESRSDFIRNAESIAWHVRRELDPRPIDEAFARSVAVGIREFPPAIMIWEIGAKVSIHREEDSFFLSVGSTTVAVNPTIGQFWTAARLFSVEVQQKAEVQ